MSRLKRIEFYEQASSYGKTLRFRELDDFVPRKNSVEGIYSRRCPVGSMNCGGREVPISGRIFRLSFSDAMEEGVDPDEVFIIKT